VDAVEVLNGRASAEDCERARRLAAAHGKPGVGGSDAHHIGEMFRAGTRFACRIESVSDLVREIRLGRCEAVRVGKK
jgi:predicted metal-dependent phosphoesterase TrpH